MTRSLPSDPLLHQLKPTPFLAKSTNLTATFRQAGAVVRYKTRFERIHNCTTQRNRRMPITGILAQGFLHGIGDRMTSMARVLVARTPRNWGVARLETGSRREDAAYKKNITNYGCFPDCDFHAHSSADAEADADNCTATGRCSCSCNVSTLNQVMQLLHVLTSPG